MSRHSLKELIIKKIGLSDLSPQEQDEFLIKLEEQVLRQATLDILESLPVEERVELEALISGSDDESIVRILREKLGGDLEKKIEDSANGHLNHFVGE
jgi:hypothetical protein